MNASAPRAVEYVFFDGECALCQRGVRIVLAADRDGSRFRFAPLGGETWRQLVAQGERERLPDSLVVRTGAGDLLVRSRAVRHVLARLGGVWRLLTVPLALLPSALLDRAYDAVARSRHRYFKRPTDACPVAPPEVRARFDP